MSSPTPSDVTSSAPFHRLGLVGTGAMGRGIAQLAAQAGLEVMLHDARTGAVDEARDFIAGIWSRGVAKGRLSEDDQASYQSRLHEATELEDLAGCDIVVEAIVEDLDVKQDLFRRLEAVIADDAVLATNTSSLSVTAIASACRLPQRVIGFHFFNPVPLMKIVEVIPGLRTSREVVDHVDALGQAMGHFTARATDTPGFLVNHAGRAFGTEALRILGERVTDHATIDRILVDQGGFRMGPFSLLDLTGLDVSHAVMESIYHQYYEEARFRPSPLTRSRLDAGLLGRKSGEGFYCYQEGQAVVAKEPSAPAATPLPIWISREDPEAAQALSAVVTAAGWTLEQRDQPSPDSLCLLTPLGEDATQTALRLGLDARRCVAIDMLGGLDKRRSLMTTPATQTRYRDAAWALLGADGTPVSVLNDSNGFVLQRVVACIVNVGADIAQQGVAEPATLDRAVELGLGYPRGPLAMGDHFGGRRILSILDNMFAATRDPRYRPSPWLRRRAMLGLPLATPEST
ncbi:3-hydroxyacyl-CoA dehydrogenase [Halomonas urumqiensis]|uniref:3-hydroxyacyl-CoA dehydrogenase n=1 Tax=Halomonas urumqiensis TaxID=1684789 RepID=A0A2N7ULY3_9GAMM|nr:3-hydroxyacyl-CoA dehydrogenase [Halomonas urumqiensis]PMR81409.1 3-hydroxyacyl-CoA dehydrogenase [Halomonas urumqiensis]PTB01209.1 3-hydroxyacyl-CoA dehydrogenase [Halomonas urumqiensis]GHE22787.1 3-hydroxyacyl-CoA dehydrogenase [Halomonas urumqiensis]